MKASEFIKTLMLLVENCDTLYVKGCFGQDLNDKKAKVRYTNNNPFNKQTSRVNKINAVNSTTFGFDCVNLIKGVLWGFNFQQAPTLYGGAEYKSNGVPDFGADDIMKYCYNVKTYREEEPRDGEALWMPGHCGIYIGAGQVIECTPKWKDGVQLVNYANRGWKQHGWLKFIEDDINIPEADKDRPYHIVKKGDNLSRIAKMYNTTWQKLKKINNIPNANLIFEGQKIFLK